MLQNVTNYLPLPDCLTIKKSKLHGLGMFATKKIPSGYDFGMTHVADGRFPNGYIRTPLGGFINHSYHPNCTMPENEDLYKLVSLREIKKGDELTVNYMPWYGKEVLATFN